jgi:hypothetical protein
VSTTSRPARESTRKRLPKQEVGDCISKHQSTARDCLPTRAQVEKAGNACAAEMMGRFKDHILKKLGMDIFWP